MTEHISIKEAFVTVKKPQEELKPKRYSRAGEDVLEQAPVT